VAYNTCTVGGGAGNAAIGNSSTVGGGQSNIASGTASTIVGGSQAFAGLYGMQAYAAGRFTAPGDAQISTFVLRKAASGDTATTLFLNGSSERLTISTGKVLAFTATICGTREGLADQAMFVRKGLIKNTAGTTSLVGSIETIGTDVKTAGASTTSVALTADTSNNALQIDVVGVAGQNWRWVARVEAVEIGY
jgi:hypothetical protein